MKGKEYTENNMRSRLYKRIVDCFPDGYATGTTVSREGESFIWAFSVSADR